MLPQPLEPTRPRRRHRCLGAGVALLACFTAAAANAQTAPSILHDEIRCIVAGKHPILEALVEPADDLVTVKVYFRADLYSLFYFVEMTRSEDVFRAVLPRPSPEIGGIVYYIEAMDSGFNSVRTEEFRPEVSTEEASCRDKNPTPVAYLEGPANITVGATGAGPNFPQGFLTEGIIGTITAAGRAVGGGGPSTGLVVALGAGAATGVGVLVSGSGDSEEPPDPIGGPTTTAPTTTSAPTTTTTAPALAPVVACFTTEPDPPTIPVGASVRFDATCSEPERELIASYMWRFNDGRGDREGRVVNRVYNDPGVFPAELIVTDVAGNQDRTSKQVRVEEQAAPPPGGGPPGPPSTADVQVTGSVPPTASVSSPVSFTITVQNNGPLTANGVSFTSTVSGAFTGFSGSVSPVISTCTFTPPSANCSASTMAPGEFFTVTITVTPTAPGTLSLSASATSASPPDTVSNNSIAIATTASLKAPLGSPGRRLTSNFTSHLELAPGDGSAHAQVTVNDRRTDDTDNAAPQPHQVRGRLGDNVVEAVLLSEPVRQGHWRFDFQNAPHFEPGSFVVESGQLVSQSASEIVFRVSPASRRLRFRFRMSP